jgi:hypothetical protein
MLRFEVAPKRGIRETDVEYDTEQANNGPFPELLLGSDRMAIMCIAFN